MAIKAKIKAKAPGPLFINCWPIFLASNRVFGMKYHHKKFQPFLWCIARFRGGCGMNGERVAWIFHSFFNFQPSFLIIIENIFGIFFLNMIEGIVIFIWLFKIFDIPSIQCFLGNCVRFLGNPLAKFINFFVDCWGMPSKKKFCHEINLPFYYQKIFFHNFLAH